MFSTISPSSRSQNRVVTALTWGLTRDPGMPPEGMPGRQGLRAEHVERRPPQPPCRELLEQGLLIEQRAA
jgi:hypothetical protein